MNLTCVNTYKIGSSSRIWQESAVDEIAASVSERI